jgi:YVTN family beta-propeller protein
MNMNKERLVIIIIGILLIGYAAIFNYGGCGSGKSTSTTGSSSGTFLIYTDPSTNVTSNSVTLHGRVNPGGRLTSVYFKYGTTSACVNSTNPSTSIGAGTTTVDIDYNLTNLSPHTLYYFKVAANRGGVTIYGTPNQTFTTEPAPPICTTKAASDITYDSARLNGTVNPNEAATDAYFEYGITTTPITYPISTTPKSIGSGISNVAVTETITSLTLNTFYNFRVAGTNSKGTNYGNNLVFITGNSFGSAPTCTTDEASDITYDSARLNGTVIPNGVATDAYFEYGITTTPITYPISTTLQPIGNGITSVAISATVSSLTPNTLYNFRVVGTNGPLTTTYGNNLTFTTIALPPPPPTCTTNDATNITRTSAALNGTVNPNGYDVTYCYFDYGTSESYGSHQDVASLPGSGTSPISVTANVLSLSPITQYNFRVVATNAGGTTNGLNQTFTTTAGGVDDYCWVPNYSSANVTRIRKSDSTTTTITVGSSPFGVTVDETYVWVANGAGGNITRILKSDLSTTNITVGTNPRGLMVDETYCWVANQGSNNVTRIKKSDSTTTTIAMGTSSSGIAVDGTYVWVTNQSANNVTRIKKSDLTTTTIAMGTYPWGVAVDGTYVWVTNNTSNNVTRIKKSDSTTTNITVGTNPRGLTVDEIYCWVANNGTGANTVTRIKKSDLTTTNITVGTAPYGVAVDGTYVWVVNNGSNNVTRIQKSDYTTTTIPSSGTSPYSLGDITGYAYDNYSQGP